MIRVLPFKHVNAFTDIDNRTIYLSLSADSDDIDGIMKDKFAHIVSGSATHGEEWRSTCRGLYGSVPPHSVTCDESLEELKFGANIGNITGIQNMLLDYHLLQAYRRFSQKVLSTEGSWEVDGDNKIRLKPTPKGTFPVVVRYIPTVDNFKLPWSKELASRMLTAEAKIMLGMTRRKLNIPGPGGNSMAMDGGELVQEGTKEKEEILGQAVRLGEPLGFLSK